jgi:hypothetical protein
MNEAENMDTEAENLEPEVMDPGLELAIKAFTLKHPVEALGVDKAKLKDEIMETLVAGGSFVCNHYVGLEKLRAINNHVNCKSASHSPVFRARDAITRLLLGLAFHTPCSTRRSKKIRVGVDVWCTISTKTARSSTYEKYCEGLGWMLDEKLLGEMKAKNDEELKQLDLK